MMDPRPSGSLPKLTPGGAAGTNRPQQFTLYTLSEDETLEVGRWLASGLQGGELVLLDGELGLGKTVLTRGIAAGLGVAPEDVSSPSFTLVQEYKGGRVAVYHVDLYRLEDLDDFESLGLEEILSCGAIVIVEWGERLPPRYRRDVVTVKLYDMGEGARRIEVLTPGSDPPERIGDA